MVRVPATDTATGFTARTAAVLGAAMTKPALPLAGTDETTAAGTPNQMKGTNSLTFKKVGNDLQVVFTLR